MKAELKKHKSYFEVKTPYDKELIELAHSKNAKWKATNKVWVFDNEHLEEVQNFLLKKYGTIEKAEIKNQDDLAKEILKRVDFEVEEVFDLKLKSETYLALFEIMPLISKVALKEYKEMQLFYKVCENNTNIIDYLSKCCKSLRDKVDVEEIEERMTKKFNKFNN